MRGTIVASADLPVRVSQYICQTGGASACGYVNSRNRSRRHRGSAERRAQLEMACTGTTLTEPLALRGQLHKDGRPLRLHGVERGSRGA